MATENGPISDDRRVISADGYRDGRIKGLMLDLAAPRAGERLLDIGCRSGEHLLLFRKKGCDVTGIDSSPLHLDLARQRLGQGAELHEGSAEDLPFSDNEFDLVTLLTSLEFTGNPGKAVAEAIRVCRGRLFIGVMNRFSLIGVQGKLWDLFHLPRQEGTRFFHLSSLNALIRKQLQGVRTQWGSVLFLPWDGYASGAGIEERLPVMNNPFGAFFGLSVSVNFSYRTAQQVIEEPVALRTETGGPLPDVASRGWTHGA
ncbi:MAG: class I SAM-dependent methyltransferase [Deltaproteobacteria bacterium]|nr:class I SAM-dependent methyltransferase [Deltaproteobacteria bacterium]